MSESFIQSQYLFNQITKQFFKDKPSIRDLSKSDTDIVDEESSDQESEHQSQSDIDLDESDSDNDDEYKAYFLETNESGLNYEFTLCDEEPDILKEYTICICGYQITNTYNLPFLQYVLNKQEDVLKFPEFRFKCATNLTIDEDSEYSPKHIFFQNECSKYILNFSTPLDDDSIEKMYKGFVKSKDLENTIYVFFDLTSFSINTTKHGSYFLSTIDEIINKHQSKMLNIDPSVYNIFYQIPDTMTLKNKWGKRIPIPFVLYPCVLTESGYKNTFHNSDVQEDTISIIDERINNPYFGSIYIFSTKPLYYDIDQNYLLKRYAVFTTNPIYIFKTIQSIDPKNNGFRLSSIIPKVVSYIKQNYIKPVQESKDEEEEEEEEESKDEESKDEEEEEEESNETEEKEEESKDEESKEDKYKYRKMKSQLQQLDTQFFSSVYYQDIIEETKIAFWGIKSSTQFTIL